MLHRPGCGGAESLELEFQARGVDVSPFLMNMIPYLLTLLVLTFWGLRGRSAAPGEWCWR